MTERLDTYGGRLRAARGAAKLNQQQLAERAGISQGQVSDLETDKYDGSTYTAQLAHATGVQALWLATGEGPRKATAKHDPRTVEGFVATLNEVESVAREERVRFRPGGLATVSLTVYRIELAEGRRPSRAIILEFIRSAA